MHLQSIRKELVTANLIVHGQPQLHFEFLPLHPPQKDLDVDVFRERCFGCSAVWTQGSEFCIGLLFERFDQSS